MSISALSRLVNLTEGSCRASRELSIEMSAGLTASRWTDALKADLIHDLSKSHMSAVFWAIASLLSLSGPPMLNNRCCKSPCRSTNALTTLTMSFTYIGHRNSSSKKVVGLPWRNPVAMNCRKRTLETGTGDWGPKITLDLRMIWFAHRSCTTSNQLLGRNTSQQLPTGTSSGLIMLLPL